MDDAYNVKFNQKITWNRDTMKIVDSISKNWENTTKEISDNLNKQIETEIFRHFEIDMTELREFLRYKETKINIPRWIPVSEKLPENDDFVCVTIKDEGGDTSYIYSDIGWYFDKAGCWIVEARERTDIIAWMPLPKPYIPQI